MDSIEPITDKEVSIIAADLFSKRRPPWPEEIRQIVTKFIAIREERSWYEPD